jgi:hypothetical protein
MPKITGAYTRDYKDGFKTAYLLGPTVALRQIHEWRQEELDAKSQRHEIVEPLERETAEERSDRLRYEAQYKAEYDAEETKGTPDQETQADNADKVVR